MRRYGLACVMAWIGICGVPIQGAWVRLVEAPEESGGWAVAPATVSVPVLQQQGPFSEHAGLIAKALAERAGDALDGVWVEPAAD